MFNKNIWISNKYILVNGAFCIGEKPLSPNRLLLLLRVMFFIEKKFRSFRGSSQKNVGNFNTNTMNIIKFGIVGNDNLGGVGVGVGLKLKFLKR
jgi:hypothetical protein